MKAGKIIARYFFVPNSGKRNMHAKIPGYYFIHRSRQMKKPDVSLSEFSIDRTIHKKHQAYYFFTALTKPDLGEETR